MILKRKALFLLIVCNLVCSASSPAQQRHKAIVRPSFDQSAFDVFREKLPPNYPGHYFPTIFAAVAKRQGVSLKGEYETTSDYNNRMAQLNSLPLAGSLRIDSLLAFVVGPANQNYDADQKVLNLSYSLPAEIKWLHTEKGIGSYVGRNAFNRAVSVKAYRYDDYILVIEGASSPADKLDASITLDAAEAQRIRPYTRVLLVCYSLVGASSDRDHSGPTIDEPYDEYTFTYKLNVSPIELWFFDSSTGMILAKRRLGTQRVVKAETISKKRTGPPSKCPPAMVEQPEPHYSEEARVKEVTGTVTLSALFKETGEITDITVINSLPNGLTEKAIEAAKGIKFLSPVIAGKKIPCRVTLDYNFNLY